MGDKALSRLAGGLDASQRVLLGQLDELQGGLAEYRLKLNETLSDAHVPAQELQLTLSAITEKMQRFEEGFSKFSPERIGQGVDALQRHTDLLLGRSEQQLRLMELGNGAQVQVAESTCALDEQIERLSLTLSRLNEGIEKSFHQHAEARNQQDEKMHAILDRLDRWTERISQEEVRKRSWWCFGSPNGDAA